MPGLKHQSIVQILRDEPQLLVIFLGRSGFQLPAGAIAITADSDLSHRSPRMLKELRSDNVFLFQGMDEKVAVVVEVQTSRPNHKRKLTWPCYVTSAREVYDCKAYLLVVAASRDALTGTLSLSIHEARMFALASIARAQPDRYYRYVHLIRIFTPRRARQELEQLMEDFFKDPFIDRFIEEGKQQGMEQGRQLGRADSATRVLLTILTARGIAIADQLRSRIAECTDPDLLERWATRAATSTTIDEVFAS
jgi:hypothetical protein